MVSQTLMFQLVDDHLLRGSEPGPSLEIPDGLRWPEPARVRVNDSGEGPWELRHGARPLDLQPMPDGSWVLDPLALELPPTASLRVVRANPAELEAHEARLNAMETSGANVLWRALER